MASSVEEIDIRDDCDPATFNAAFPGPEVICVEDGEGPWGDFGGGSVTFDEFLTDLLAGEGHPAWRNNPDDTHIDFGESLKAINEGGEFHTFTEVAAFGGGCIPELNGPLGLTPVPECADLTQVAPGEFVPTAFLTTGVPAGGSLDVSGLDPGTHRFMCLIHPWMQTTVEVEND